MTTKTLLLVTFILCAALHSRAQTADEVIEKYLLAIGGKARLDSIHSIYMEGVSSTDNGNELQYKIYRVKDRLLRREVSSGTITNITIVTPKEGWASDRLNAGAYNTLPQDQVNARQYELECISPLLDYQKKMYTAKFSGTEVIAGNPAYKIELNLDAGQVFTYFIDWKTNLLVRETRLGKGETTPVVVEYGNYKQHAGGCFFPMYITGRLGIVEITKLEVNVVVDGKLFRP